MTDPELLKRVVEALGRVTNPQTGRDLVLSGMVKEMRTDEDGGVRFRLLLRPNDPPDLVGQARDAAESVVGVGRVTIDVDPPERAPAQPARRALPVLGPRGARPTDRHGAAPGPGPRPGAAPPTPRGLPGVKHVIAVSSAKGGVGKSTVAANLAAALAVKGHAVGILDSDVYGPDIPIMFGIHEKPRVQGERVLPLTAHGVKLMSVGFLIDAETPAIWRGPIVMGIIRQFLEQVVWGELDYLFVDMPPGTGDAQLSLVQLVELVGAVMVTTPQDVAVADVLKGIKMFERVEVPVLGLVENMSGFVCPHCGATTDVFGRGGGQALAASAGVPFLGVVPLGPSVVASGDRGRPVVLEAPDSPEAKALIEIAEKVAAAVEAAAKPVSAR